MLSDFHEYRQNRQADLLVGGLVGDACSTDNDCILGQCDDDICVDAPKACPQDCSGVERGVCTKVNVNDEVMGDEFVCLARDPYCKVACSCFASFYGSDCSLNWLTEQNQKELRESLSKQMYDLTLFQDLDEEVAASRNTAINDILVDIALVNNVALTNLTLSAILSVESASQYYESKANSEGMLTVLSNLLKPVVWAKLPDSLYPQLADSLRPRLFDTLKTVSFSRMKGLPVTSMDGISTVEKGNIRIQEVKALMSDVITSTISSPLTYVQKTHSATPPAVYELVAVDGLNEFDTLGISILEYNSNFKEGESENILDQSIAIPSKILLQTYKDTAPNFVEVIVTQQHVQSLDLESMRPEVLFGEVKCLQSSNAYNVSIPCQVVEGDPLLTIDYVTCPGDEGILNYTCALVQKQSSSLVFLGFP